MLTDIWRLDVIEAGVVIGQGDEERDCGDFAFVALPHIGDNLLIQLADGHIPLRFHDMRNRPARGDAVHLAAVGRVISARWRPADCRRHVPLRM